MLYIDIINTVNARFSNVSGGGGYDKIHHLNTLYAQMDELDRVHIINKENQAYVIGHYLYSDITLNGLVPSSSQSFVTLFNALVTTALSNVSSTTPYNTPGAGTFNATSKNIPANTIHAITIVCISGTATITVNGESVGIQMGQSFSYNATGLIDSDIDIVATGQIDYVTMGPSVTTTTTTAPVTTTTTTA